MASHSDYGIVELFEAWDDRLTLQFTKLIQRHMRGQTAFKVYFGVNTINCKSIQLRASFRSAHKSLWSGYVGYRNGSVSGDLSAVSAGDTGHSNEQMMFVGVVHVLQNPQQITLEVCPSVIWLESLNNGGSTGGDAFDVSLFDGGFVFLNGVADRKLMPMSGCSPILRDEMTDEMIQSRAEMIYDLPRHNGVPQ